MELLPIIFLVFMLQVGLALLVGGAYFAGRHHDAALWIPASFGLFWLLWSFYALVTGLG